MRQWIWSALIEMMACRLFVAKPLFKPMPTSVNWSLKNKLQWNFNQNTNFHSQICILRYCLRNGRHFLQGKWVKHFWYTTDSLFIYCRRKNVITGSTSSETWTWWRHQMETFSALLAVCAGNSLLTGEFPSQRPVTRSIDVFFGLRLNERLSKQSWGWWFETPSHSFTTSL